MAEMETMAGTETGRVPPSVLAYAARLSPRAQRAFRRGEWSFDVDMRCSHEELRRRLAAQGLPEWPFLWPIEEAFGGVAGLRGVEIGVADMLDAPVGDDLRAGTTGAQLLPIGYQGQFYLYLGSDGAVYSDMAGPLDRSHPSFDAFLEEEAMNASLREWYAGARQLRFEVRQKDVGKRVAEKMGLPAVPEASSELHRWWQTGAVTISDDAHAGATVVRVKSLEDLVAALLRTVDIAPDVQVRPSAGGLVTDLPRRRTTRAELLSQAVTREALRARRRPWRLPLGDRAYGAPRRGDEEGDVWITGEGGDLRIDALERSFGALTSWWTIGVADSRHLTAPPTGP